MEPETVDLGPVIKTISEEKPYTYTEILGDYKQTLTFATKEEMIEYSKTAGMPANA